MTWVWPDYANAYSALDAHECPLLTFREMMAFLQAAGETPNATRIAYALYEMCNAGSVWRLVREGQPPLYALERRVRFRRDLKRQQQPPRRPPPCPSTCA